MTQPTDPTPDELHEARQEALRAFTLYRRQLLANDLETDERESLARLLGVIEEEVGLGGAYSRETTLPFCEALGLCRKHLRATGPLSEETRAHLVELLNMAEEILV